jgi:hypothetical protein
MPSPRSLHGSLQGQQRPRRGLLILALGLLGLAAVSTVWEEQHRQRRDDPRPLEAWVPAGWRVQMYPDDPGPFVKFGESPIYAPGHSGTFSYRTPHGLVTHRFPVRNDVEQKALLLKTFEGTLTLAILER